MKYKRILLKLSGEQLAGKFENGIDPELAAWFAKEVKKLAESGTWWQFCARSSDCWTWD